jgi:4-hydroxy-2-oxoglutarate aldolase
VSAPAFASSYPRKNLSAPFLVLGGYTDFLLPSAFANGHGIITGLANIAPVSSQQTSLGMRSNFVNQHAINALFQLAEASTQNVASLPEAQRLQGVIARADGTIARASIAGTKVLLEKFYGYGGVPRKPLPPLDPDAAEALWKHPDTVALIALEREMSRRGV